MSELANVIAWRGAAEEAERLHREVLAIDTRVFGREHVEMASELEHWARSCSGRAVTTRPSPVRTRGR